MMTLKEAYLKAYPDGKICHGEHSYQLKGELHCAPFIPLPLAIDDNWHVESKDTDNDD